MKVVKILRNALICSLLLNTSIATAGVIEFEDYQTSFTNFSFRNMQDVLPGIDVRVEAAIFSNSSSLITNIDTGSSDERRVVLLDDDGLGIVGINTDQGGKIDGNSGNDLLIFTFSETVNFAAIDFSSISSADDFEFGFIEGDTFNRVLSNEDVSEYYEFASPFTGTQFGIGAVASNDSFRIDAITVVSEPSTLAVLAFGMLGFGLRRRNKQ